MSTGLEYIMESLSTLGLEEVKRLVAEIDTAELAEYWDEFSDDQKIRLFTAMDLESKLDLLYDIPVTSQEQLVMLLSTEHAKVLWGEMEPDDLVDFIQNVSPEVRKSVWQNLSDDAKRESLFLLRFDEDDAAGLMTPRYLAIRSTITVAQALQFVRKGLQEVETVYYIYVLDQVRRLTGVVSLRDLLAAQDSAVIETIMEDKVISVLDQTDQEEVAKILETHDFLAIPVVDSFNRMLGIVTFDDVIDVIREEQTEDVYKMGAMEGSADKYLETGIFKLVKKRIPWLIILLILGTVSTNVVHHYQALVLGAAFLFIFMPIITQTGGNSGNQSSTLMIRGLATGQVDFRDVGRVLLKEIAVGLLLGLGTGVVILLRSYFLPPGVDFLRALTIGVSLVIVVIFSTIVGAFAPLLIHRLGFDPTVMSGPLMATVIDVCGLTIYFETAKLLLKL